MPAGINKALGSLISVINCANTPVWPAEARTTDPVYPVENWDAIGLNCE